MKMDCIEIFVLHTVAITVMDIPASIYALTAALLTRNTHGAKTALTRMEMAGQKAPYSVMNSL